MRLQPLLVVALLAPFAARYMHDLAAVDIDDFVHAHEVAGIEICSDATAPAPISKCTDAAAS